MDIEPSFYSVSRRPTSYLQQGRSSCGLYTVHGILQAYGLPVPQKPEDMHTSFLGRLTGITSQWTLIKQLRSRAMDAEWKSAWKETNSERIELLKRLLRKDAPVTLLIGTAGRVTSRWAKIRKKYMGHWITLWGYDDTRQKFYIYDPLVAPKNPNSLPIGNAEKSYSETLSAWKGPTLWLPFFLHYLYITVDKTSPKCYTSRNEVGF